MKREVFDSENLLVETFLDELIGDVSPWGSVLVDREFDYARGRTDVVVLTHNGDVVAFEAKLTRWRVALHQAYRNTCFADASYVLLPKTAAIQAGKFADEFVRRGVGLCYLDSDQGIVVLYEGKISEPIQPWLRRVAVDRVTSSNRD